MSRAGALTRLVQPDTRRAARQRSGLHPWPRVQGVAPAEIPIIIIGVIEVIIIIIIVLIMTIITMAVIIIILIIEVRILVMIISNNSGRPDRKRAPIHRCVALHDSIPGKKQNFSKPAAMGSPENSVR